MAAAGVPLLGLIQDESRYFDWHHTAADTFDKIEPRALAESTAFLATAAYVLAEKATMLPRPRLNVDALAAKDRRAGVRLSVP